MRFVTLATAAAATATTVGAVQLPVPRDMNMDRNKIDLERPTATLAKFRPALRNHQLVDHMAILNRDHIPRSLEGSIDESKPYIDLDGKEDKTPFVPPSSTDVETQTPLDSAEDEDPVIDEPNQPEPALPVEAPIDEATQTEPALPLEPKSKPMPKEKPSPEGPILGEPVEKPSPVGKPPPADKAPPKPKPGPRSLLAKLDDEPTEKPKPIDAKPPPADKAPPKPKPGPRSLLAQLAFQDAPTGKPKPGPKGKPMPNQPMMPYPPVNMMPNQPMMPKGKPMPMMPNQPMLPYAPVDSMPIPDAQFFQSMPGFISNARDERSILRANMNLLASPHSADYSDEAYVAIQAVQDYCVIDYSKFCDSSALMNARPPYSYSPKFGNWGDDKNVDDQESAVFFVGAVNSIFDLFNNILGGPQTASIFINVDDDEVIDELFGDGEMIQNSPCSKKNSGPQAILEPMQERQLHRSSSSSHDSSSGSHESGHSHGERHFGHGSHGPRHPDIHRPPPPPPPVPDAPTFLGFGQDGDMCLMAHYDSLSTACQSSIDDAYVLRDEYVSEEPNPGCAFILGVLTTLALVTVFLLVSRRRRQKVIATLTAIHNDPELKARVEAASGIAVPKPCCAQSDKPTSEPSRGAKCLKVFLRIMITLVMSFLLVHLAARFTLEVANGMVYTDEETGETFEPKPVSVLLIFISFLLAEILIIVALKRCLVACVTRRRRNAFASSGTSATASSSNGGFGRFIPSISPPSRRFSFFRTSPAANVYAPLMTDEESHTEMIQSPSIVVASAPMQHQVVYLPPTMPSHVAAQSVSSVSMI
jgi:hypothetical protein